MADEFQVAACKGKAPFDAYETAAKILGKRSRRAERLGKRRPAREIFKCRYCGRYHVAGR